MSVGRSGFPSGRRPPRVPRRPYKTLGHGGIVAADTYEVWMSSNDTARPAVGPEQNNVLNAALASIGDAVIVVDEKAQVAFLNPIAEALTGWSATEAMQRPLSQIFHIVNERTRAPVENPVDKVLQSGLVQGLANHTVLLTKDGREVPIDDSAAPIRTADGLI